MVLVLYARLIALTARLRFSRSGFPPDGAGVLAIWHGSTPALMGVIAACRPGRRLAVMVATDPRGDLLALFCRWLGLSVVRGDAEHGSRQALLELARHISQGGWAVITADGGGPRGRVHAGVVVLASLADSPIVPVGADCRPALRQPHKWDRPRYPLPFSRIALKLGSPILPEPLSAPEELQRAQGLLKASLNRVDAAARNALTGE